MALVIAYCLGLGIPFLVLALGSGWAVSAFGWLRRHTRAIQVFGGIPADRRRGGTGDRAVE